MAFKVLLDANVLLDFFLKRESYDSAERIISLVESGQVQGYVTPSIIHVAGYFMTKVYGSVKADDMLLSLLVDVQVIEIDHEIAINALHSRIEDSEDALQYYAGLHHKLDCFISRDKQLQQSAIAVLPVYTPEEFLNISFDK